LIALQEALACFSYARLRSASGHQVAGHVPMVAVALQEALACFSYARLRSASGHQVAGHVPMVAVALQEALACFSYARLRSASGHQVAGHGLDHTPLDIDMCCTPWRATDISVVPNLKESYMKSRRIGDVEVSAIGLGGMPMSIEGRPDEQRSISTIHAALDAGISLIDTADAYHLHADEVGHNESLIAKALAAYGGDTSTVLVATKGGHLRPGDGSWTLNGDPAYLKQAAEASLKRLGVDAIGLYQFHRPDPRVPYADSVGAIRDLLDDGKIKMAGISNADPAQIRLANEILGGRLVSVQNQFSPAFRSSEPELDLCDELGIAFLPWSPLGGISAAGGLGQKHSAFQQIAAEHGISPQQVCLTWMLAKSPHVVPIPGSSRPETIRDSAQAVDVVLGAEELVRLDAS